MTDSEGENTVGGALHEAGDAPGTEEREQQRIAALRAMSGETNMTSAPIARGASVPTRDQRRWSWRRILLVVLIVLVIGGSVTGYVLVARPRSQVSQQHKSTPVSAIHLAASKLYCPQAPVWSPDGRQIAIIASDLRCNESNSGGTPNQSVGIFDVMTGNAQRIIALKDVLARHQLGGLVTAISWSPDGKTLALFGPVRSASTVGPTQQAIILYSTTNQQATPRIVIAPPQPDPHKTQIWNVGASTAGPLMDTTLAPAMSYRWTVDGHIVPDQPLAADITGTTGRAANDGDFTFWQAGELDAMYILDGHYRNTFLTNGSAELIHPTGVFFFASPVLWSADSQYVVSGIGIGGPVTFSTPPASTVTCPSSDQSQDIPCPPQVLPQPDPAFAQVVKATLKGEAFAFTTQSGN